MKITNILLVAILLTTASCKDWLNMVPKNERVVSNIEDVKAELLTYWSSSTYASLPVASYGNSSALSLPLYNDVNAQLAMYEDNLDMLTFNTHSDINAKCMTHYYQDINWKGINLANSLWDNGYTSIGFMNAILYDLDGVTYTLAEYETIGGEARVIRAWNILKMLEFFAPYKNNQLGIPLNLNSENVTPGGRYTQTEIYKIIERELKEVLTYTTPSEKWNFFYTQDFVKSCLAEMYMFKAGSAAAEETDWEMAEKYSSEVIASYVPENRAELLTDMFSGESVVYNNDHPYCALKLATVRFCNIGSSFTGIWGTNNAQQVNQELLAMYDENDIRKTAWFKSKEVEGRHRWYVSKPITYYYGPVCDILVLYRKADQYLINAEAKCHLGREAEAAEMLATFQAARVPGSLVSSGDYEDVLSEILKERRKELCFEYGSRWLDMKRLGLTCTREGLDEKKDGQQTYKLESDDYRYALPIPTSIELDLHNNVKQNPGWTSFD